MFIVEVMHPPVEELKYINTKYIRITLVPTTLLPQLLPGIYFYRLFST